MRQPLFTKLRQAVFEDDAIWPLVISCAMRHTNSRSMRWREHVTSSGCDVSLLLCDGDVDDHSEIDGRISLGLDTLTDHFLGSISSLFVGVFSSINPSAGIVSEVKLPSLALFDPAITRSTHQPLVSN